MDLFKSYELVEAENGGFDLILHFDKGSMDAEFAGELSKSGRDKDGGKQNLVQGILEKFPDLKINTVKIMLGAALVSSFIPVLPAYAQAAETSAGTTQTQSAYNYNIKVSVNGRVKTFQNKPFIYNNITYVPISEFGRTIGANVWWNSSSKTVGIKLNDKSIAFVRGNSVARVNGVKAAMPASLSIKGVTYAPLRFIAENLGYKVTLNSTARTVDVSKGTAQTKYTVSGGDSLWSIAKKFGITVDALKRANNLTSNNILPGQTLNIPKAAAATPAPAPYPAPASGTKWPAVTYVVQPGDTATSISKNFGVPAADIIKYNYMTSSQWFEAGDKIAISGYAPRAYTVTPGQAKAPARRGTPVDWVLEGQYLVKRNASFTVVDVVTGKQFKARMIGGYNHIDIEPLTSADTATMKSLFGTWKWSPRAVVIYFNGMNLAASLSGMPHDVDTITANGVNGHFDVYMKNSSSHSSTASSAYIQEHNNMVMKAAGQ
ncbi:MAG: LysM domain protein [Eubacterium sp.]|jgi:LysM repeat protein|nr:LysM domain protein [Eubacterium sp.]